MEQYRPVCLDDGFDGWKPKMPTAHCVSSLDGIILEVDQGFLDLVRRKETDLVGRSYREITDARDLNKSAEMLARLVDRAPPVQLHKRYLRPDGTSIAANLLVSRFCNPDRLVSTLLWHDSERDASLLNLWETALRVRHMHSVRMAEFGNDLSHDPVGSLLISLYLAEAEGRLIGLQQLASEADMSEATLLRWIKLMQQRGFVVCSMKVPLYVQFTQDGMKKMENTLSSSYHIPESMIW